MNVLDLLMCNSNDAAKDYLQKEIEILRTKSHWKKAYFYLWDEVQSVFQLAEKLAATYPINET